MNYLYRLFFLVISIIFYISYNSIAQSKFTSRSISVSATEREQINKSLISYNLVSFETERIFEHVRDKKGSFRLELEVGQKKYSLIL